MPFALVLIGLILIVTGARNTYRELGAELVSDFTGPGNFTYWVISIGAVGAVGYIPAARNLSRIFLVLILLAMILSNGGFFNRFVAAIQSGPETQSGSSLMQPGSIAQGAANMLNSVKSTVTNIANFAKWFV